MNPILARGLTWAFTNKWVLELVINIVNIWAKDSKNQFDDQFVVGVAKALDLRLNNTTTGPAVEPPDDNLFLGDDDLNALKADRDIQRGRTPKTRKKK